MELEVDAVHLGMIDMFVLILVPGVQHHRLNKHLQYPVLLFQKLLHET